MAPVFEAEFHSRFPAIRAAISGSHAPLEFPRVGATQISCSFQRADGPKRFERPGTWLQPDTAGQLAITERLLTIVQRWNEKAGLQLSAFSRSRLRTLQLR